MEESCPYIHQVIGTQILALAVDPSVVQGQTLVPLSHSPGALQNTVLDNYLGWATFYRSPGFQWRSSSTLLEQYVSTDALERVRQFYFTDISPHTVAWFCDKWEFLGMWFCSVEEVRMCQWLPSSPTMWHDAKEVKKSHLSLLLSRVLSCKVHDSKLGQGWESGE